MCPSWDVFVVVLPLWQMFTPELASFAYSLNGMGEGTVLPDTELERSL